MIVYRLPYGTHFERLHKECEGTRYLDTEFSHMLPIQGPTNLPKQSSNDFNLNTSIVGGRPRPSTQNALPERSKEG